MATDDDDDDDDETKIMVDVVAMTATAADAATSSGLMIDFMDGDFWQDYNCSS